MQLRNATTKLNIFTCCNGSLVNIDDLTPGQMINTHENMFFKDLNLNNASMAISDKNSDDVDIEGQLNHLDLIDLQMDFVPQELQEFDFLV